MAKRTLGESARAYPERPRTLGESAWAHPERPHTIGQLRRLPPLPGSFFRGRHRHYLRFFRVVERCLLG